MGRVGDSFAWPFRGEWRSSWPAGLVMALLLPLLFVPLLGYAVAATRAAQRDPSLGPPPFRPSQRLIADGFWTSAAILLTALPFLIALGPIGDALSAAHVLRSGDAGLSLFNARVVALLILALPWGLLALLVLPSATAMFAASGRPRDLFDLPGAIGRIRLQFSAWNLALAAIVTGWAIGLACGGLFCIGLVPGIFYAILVSAHATATLDVKGADHTAR